MFPRSTKGSNEYLSMLIKYWDKNIISFKNAINHHNKDNENNPLLSFVRYWRYQDPDATWLNMYFQSCDKANTIPRKIFFEKALKVCDNNPKKRQLLKPIIQQYFVKCYPK